MDPISIEENARAILDEQNQNQEFREIIVSCRSLSQYEDKRIKSLIPQIIAAAIGASFHIVVGISLAYSAILIPQLQEEGNRNSTTNSFHITENQGSWIASVIVVVAPVGAIMGGFMMDAIGRLNMIKLAAIPGAIGWILIALAGNVPMLLLGRILSGFASAWGTSPAIVYITEVASVEMRGSLISFAPTYASAGMVLCYLLGWFVNWRIVAYICTFFTIMPIFLLIFIPESPAWLVSKNRIDQARKSLEWINKYQPQPEHKTETLAEMQLALLEKEQAFKREAEKNNTGKTKSSTLKRFFLPTGYKPLLILTGLFAFQQFSGIYITLFYAVTFFQEMGSDFNPYLASVLIGVVRFVMSLVNTWMLRRFPRRELVMISAAGMAACMCSSGFFTMLIKEGRTTMTWVPIVFLLLYVVTSMVGLLSIPWTMTAELFPLEIRGVAHSIAYSVANLLMFISIQSYRSLFHWLGGSSGVQYFFAVVALLGLVYTFVFLPETHRKKLSEIEAYFYTHTTFIGGKKDEKKGAHKKLINGAQWKPIVKNSRVSGKDVSGAANGQNEQMIAKIPRNFSC